MSRLQRAFNIVKLPLQRYNEVAQKYPFETGVVTTVVKTSLADLFAQKVRHLAGHGCCCWHHFAYCVCSVP
jgi:hypothetical protein